MNKTRNKRGSQLLLAAALCFGMSQLSHALTNDATSGTSSLSSAEASVYESTGIIPGTPGFTSPFINSPTDSRSGGLGLGNSQDLTPFNMFINPIYLMMYECVYGEVWGGNGNTWGGGTVGLPVGRLATFFGRPYNGIAGSVAQPIGGGAGVTAGGDASASITLTGVQNGNGGAFLGNINNDPAPFFGHALYDSRVLAPRNMIDLLYALPVGDQVVLGLAYAYARNKDEESWSDNNPTAGTPNTANDGSIRNERMTTDHQMSIGAAVKNIGSIDILDFAINVSRVKVDNTHSEARLAASGAAAATQSSSLESDGAGNLGFVTRAIFNCPKNEGSKLIAAFTYDRPNASSKGTMRLDSDGSGQTNNVANDIDRTWETSDKGNNIKFDLAYHYMHNPASRIIFFTSYVRAKSEREFKLTENNPLVFGVAGLRDKETREETQSGIPVGVAVEHQTWSKVATRFGVRKVLFGKNEVEITDVTNRAGLILDQRSVRSSKVDASVAPTVTLGLGVKPHKDLDIDLALVSNVFDLDSGAGVSDLITRASLRWHF